MSPRDLLDEVKRFARRRPVAFLALAAAAGVVAGRVTRGAVAANTSVDSDTEPTPARAYDSDVYDRGGYDGGVQGGGAYGTRTYQRAATTRAMARWRVRPATRAAACRLPVKARYADDRLRRPGAPAAPIR